MSEHTVCVIIPAYNSAETIETCLDSVENQTVQVSRILVVDDHSSDDTITRIQEWNHRHDNRATVIPLLENGGPATARNAGLHCATEEWVAFLDADDAWFPWRLESQFTILQHHASAIFICGRTADLQSPPSNQQVSPPSSSQVQEITRKELLSHNPIATSTVLAKREAIISCGAFDTQFKGPEDYDLWLRLVAAGKCLHMDAIVSKYRTTVGSLSMDDRSFLPEVLKVLEKAFAPGGALANHKTYYRLAKAEQFTAASWMAYHRGDKSRAISLLMRSWMQTIAPIQKEKADRFQRLKLLWRYSKMPAGTRGESKKQNTESVNSL